jgi:cyclase
VPMATRIIPVLLNRNGTLVKGRSFNKSRVVGHTLQAVRIYEARNVDELIFLDVSATPNGREPDIALVRSFAGTMFCPVTVGGGVSTTDHFKALLANGADKIAINTAAVENPDLITQAAHRFGSQAVVVSIDVREGQVFTHCGQKPTGLDVVAWAQEAEKRGAGEILLTDVLAEGRMTGYNLATVRNVSDAVRIPVVANGGAGTYEHLRIALEAGAHAVAAGAMWHFTDAVPAEAAEYLASHGIAVRKRIAA